LKFVILLLIIISINIYAWEIELGSGYNNQRMESNQTGQPSQVLFNPNLYYQLNFYLPLENQYIFSLKTFYTNTTIESSNVNLIIPNRSSDTYTWQFGFDKWFESGLLSSFSFGQQKERNFLISNQSLDFEFINPFFFKLGLGFHATNLLGTLSFLYSYHHILSSGIKDTSWEGVGHSFEVRKNFGQSVDTKTDSSTNAKQSLPEKGAWSLWLTYTTLYFKSEFENQYNDFKIGITYKFSFWGKKNDN
jgi:hypothetical protein